MPTTLRSAEAATTAMAGTIGSAKPSPKCTTSRLTA
jgi:hypothetical protein